MAILFRQEFELDLSKTKELGVNDLSDKWKRSVQSYDLKTRYGKHLVSMNDLLEMAGFFYEATHLGKGKKVLDLACGNGMMNGTTYQELGYQYIDPNQDVYGCDILYNSNFDGNFAQCNVEETCFKDNSFDGVMCFCSLDHFLIPENVFEEAYRILKPTGVFFALQSILHGSPFLHGSRHEHHIYSYSVEVILALYRTFGFTDIQWAQLDKEGLVCFFRGSK